MRVIGAALASVGLATAPAQASVWEPPRPLDGVPFAGSGQIAVNDAGEVVTLLMRDDIEPRLDWLSADGTLQPTQSRRGVLGAAGDGTMFLMRGDGEKVYLATKPPGLPFGPDVPIVDGPGGPMDVNAAGDIAMGLGKDLGLWRRGAASVERITVPDNEAAYFTDVELTDGGEILAARRSSADREVVIVPPGGTARAERVGDGGGCEFQVAAGPDGRAIAAWSQPASEHACDGPQNYAALRPAGGSFSEGAPVPGVPMQTEPHIAVDANGRAVLVYDSSHPNGVKPNVIVLTAGAADTTWSTSSTVVGYTDGIAATPAGVYVAYGSGFIGPHTARVSDAGTLEDIQDVVADCEMGSVGFAVAPSGRAAMFGWRFTPQHYAILRQVPGDPSPWRCGRGEPEPSKPEPAPAPQQLSPPPVTKPATTVTATVRRASRRRVLVRFTRSDAGRLDVSGTLNVKGRRASKARTSGATAVTLTFRVPPRTWRTLIRKGARLTLRATSPEGGRWDFKRTLKR